MNFDDNLAYNNNNNNFNNNNNNSKKYKYNFSQIIAQNKQICDDKSKYTLIDYKCNICLMRDDIDLSNKINSLSLLSYIENSFKNFEYILLFLRL